MYVCMYLNSYYNSFQLNVLRHTEGRSFLACDQNIKDIPTALEVFLCFETKLNETTCM